MDEQEVTISEEQRIKIREFLDDFDISFKEAQKKMLAERRKNKNGKNKNIKNI